jgi:hypothetical protein
VAKSAGIENWLSFRRRNASPSTQGFFFALASKGSAFGLLSSGMDKAIGFLHEKTDQVRSLAAGWRCHRESRTISMAFFGSLNTCSSTAESAPWLSKNRC